MRGTDVTTTDVRTWSPTGPVPVDLLRDRILPGLLAGRAMSAPVRLWVAACSRGRDLEQLIDLVATAFAGSTSRFEIVATDRDAEALRRTQDRVEQMPWGPVVRFERLDLCDPWPWMGRFDVIDLRSVLALVGRAERLSILHLAGSILTHDGVLLFEAEGLGLAGHPSLHPVHVGPPSAYRWTD